MNKQIGMIVGVIVVVFVVGIVGVKVMGGSNKKEVQKNLPTPTPAHVYEEAEGVDATIVPNSATTEVILTITGLDGRFTGIEYELQYQTDKGPKGTLSGGKPIALISGQDEFEREVTLGTCSTGGKCTYDKGVKNFKLFVKLHDSEGNVQIFRKEFASV